MWASMISFQTGTWSVSNRANWRGGLGNRDEPGPLSPGRLGELPHVVVELFRAADLELALRQRPDVHVLGFDVPGKRASSCMIT